MVLNGQRLKNIRTIQLKNTDGTLLREVTQYGDREFISGYYSSRRKGKYAKLNPVLHTKEASNPVVFPYSGGGYFIAPTLPVWEGRPFLSFWEIPEVKSALEDIMYEELNKLEKSLRPIDTKFSLLNFLKELTELPSLLDPAKVSFKRLSKPSARKVKRAPMPKGLRTRVRTQFIDDAVADIGDTFVNGQFGYVPTISDSSELLKRFSSLESAFSSLRSKLKPKNFKRFREYHAFIRVVHDSPASIKVPIYWRISGTLRIRGRSSRDVPLLNTLGPLLATLEQGGLRLNLGVVWNAIPFSWAVDWFFPVGDFLENVGQRDALGIRTSVRGTATWKLKANAIVYQGEVTSNHPNAQEELSTYERENFYANCSYYHRTVLPKTLDDYVMPPFKTNNNWSTTKLGIAAAIANGFRRR